MSSRTMKRPIPQAAPQARPYFSAARNKEKAGGAWSRLLMAWLSSGCGLIILLLANGIAQEGQHVASVITPFHLYRQKPLLVPIFRTQLQHGTQDTFSHASEENSSPRSVTALSNHQLH